MAQPNYSPWTGPLTLAKREVVRFLVVSHQTIIPPLVSSALFLFVFGLSVGSNVQFAGLEGGYLRYIIPGLVAMYLISGSFENTSSSLFISRWHNHIQEVLLSPLSYFEMVLGLLAGGVSRGVIVSCGVFAISSALSGVGIAHPLMLLYFMLTISVIFACAGMMAALWAKDFGMLSMWSTYFITPLVFLGGVFNPIGMLPAQIRFIGWINPMAYLVSGFRYAILGATELPVTASMLVSGIGAVVFFGFTVHLFRIGWRLRT